MTRVLLTGATGYLGKNFKKSLLDAKYTVSSIVRNSSEAGEEDFVWNQNGSELFEFIKKINPKAICHLASHVSASDDIEDIQNFVNCNIELGNTLLAGASECGSSFLNISSFWQNMSGTSEYAPNSLYAAYKEAFEKLIDYYT